MSFRNDMRVKPREESSDEDRPRNHVIPVEVWDSGPVLVSDLNNREYSSYYEPGEGKSMSIREEGCKLWKNKTRRTYQEIVPRVKNGNKDKDRISNDSLDRTVVRNGNSTDRRLVSAAELDEALLEKKEYTSLGNESDFFPYLDSYLPKMEDKAIQCDLKKSSKRNVLNQNGYKVIKSDKNGSVSTYSNVPIISDKYDREKFVTNGDVIYSQVDKSRKKQIKTSETYGSSFHDNDECLYTSNATRSRSEKSPSHMSSPALSRRYTSSPVSVRSQRTRVKTKGYNLSMDTGYEGPVAKLPPRPPTPKVSKRSKSDYNENWYSNTSHSHKNSRNLKRETIEETISISNASSDECQQVTDNDDIHSPKSVIREMDKKGISYTNVNSRRSPSNPYDGYVVNSGGVWVKSLDEDYRRGMVQSEVSYPSIVEPRYPSYSTLSRIENRKKPSNRDYSPISARNALTLDKRYLQERKNRMNGEHMRHFSGNLSDKGVRYADIVDTHKITPMKKFSSSRDVSVDPLVCRRGGLAAAYKARQTRASSLNRTGSSSIGGSQSRLNAYGMSSSVSDVGMWHSRGNIHENDPIVMYIPAVSHSERKEDDRLSAKQVSRTQSILSSSKKSKSSKKQTKSSEVGEVTQHLNDYVTRNPSGIEEEDAVDAKNEKGKKTDKKSKDLRRRHSMPKDSKVPWFQKLKMRVKFKEP